MSARRTQAADVLRKIVKVSWIMIEQNSPMNTAVRLAHALAMAGASAVAVASGATLQSLVAHSPWAPRADKLHLFGQFVGDWALEVTYHHENGHTEVRRGEWHFGWILEGRAIQDVWRVPGDSESSAPVGYGTTIRMYDPDLDAWRVTWCGVLSARVTRFIARPTGSEIVMEAVGEESSFRWIFSDISTNTFRWRAVSSADGGRTWTIEQEMQAHRISN